MIDIYNEKLAKYADGELKKRSKKVAVIYCNLFAS